MATDDIQRLVSGTAPTPAHFTIPGNGQMQPKAIFATYDGTAAGSTFRPALKIISDGGETVGIYTASSVVAGGGTADVSWFPWLAGATSTSSVATLATVCLIKDGGTIPNNAYTTLPYDSVLSAHDPNGVFSINLGTGVITTNVTGVFSLETFVGFTATAPNNIRLLLNGTAGSFGKSEDSFAANSDLGVGGSLNSSAGQTFQALVFQNSGGNATILHARSTMTMLAPTP